MQSLREHPAGHPRSRLSPRQWLLTCALAAVVAPAMAGDPAPAQLSEMFVGRVAALINEYRSQHRLDRLTSAAVLEQVAEGHSQHMAQTGQPSHGGFRDRFRQVEGAVCVENIAAHFDTPEAVFEGWRRSPSHHRNLLEPRIVRMGLAARDSYVTFFACG
jgi:uncharacterized protein YkwD